MLLPPIKESSERLVEGENATRIIAGVFQVEEKFILRSYDDYQGSFFLVRGWDHDRNDYHLDYLAGDVWTIVNSGVAGIVCNVRIGAAVGA